VAEAGQGSQKDSPEDLEAAARIQKLTRITGLLVALSLMWYFAGDRCTPSTSVARVSGKVVPIVPEVSGAIISVQVGLNQIVSEGDVLLEIDPEPYLRQVERARADFARAGETIGADTGGVAAAEARVDSMQAELAAARRDAKRIISLEEAGAASEFRADNARSRTEKAISALEGARADLEAARSQLGKAGSENPRIRAAALDLENARMDLERATLRAPTEGGVTNVRVEVGQYASKGTPVMTFISSSEVWVEAYLRENALGNVQPGDEAEITLDIAPGRVFQGVVVSTGLGVDWGRAAKPGRLPSISNPSDWLREPQRFPVVIHFADDEARGLRREGGQADVIIYTQRSGLLRPLAWLWIRIISLLSFAY